MTQLNIIRPYLASPRRLTQTITPTATTSIVNSPLFKLSAELRLRIYEYAVYSDNDGIYTVTRTYGIPESPLLFTCKIIREEAISSFYGVNNFQILVEKVHPAACIIIIRKRKSLEAQGVLVKGQRRQIINYKKNSAILCACPGKTSGCGLNTSMQEYALALSSITMSSIYRRPRWPPSSACSRWRQRCKISRGTR
jgi:hypothetical protein